MAIHIEYETELSLGFDVEPVITKVIDKALEIHQCPYAAEVNVILTDNASIAVINEEYRNLARPTDVLSFPMISYETPGDFSVVETMSAEDCFDPDSGELILGDIIISVEKVIEQAETYGHSKERELGFLTAHSMLHLFGYDHMEEKERIDMEEKQETILASLGLYR
ncbi:rRNA maturation RNase YbeY [Frisingicoccus caecimuris]|uniref:Endoribonuclease YbeY n=1 Tax=Frisingicoccus caecimuris TaxID=1796636 RepID=A0A4R2LL03_9FIRM|nr:rRNA maturation RNase YbeY [Frisingicoccus caecimuris]MCR1918672.1 rRNA maturation RNase YbeY [Frisingicoccus caecimuris]TCO86304.1 putative rRNA maturation factor [Frisingicoccus caecimuris]